MIATTLEQSRKLVELGIDQSTADMYWTNNGLWKDYLKATPRKGYPEETCPAWSLAALLELMPKHITHPETWHYNFFCLTKTKNMGFLFEYSNIGLDEVAFEYSSYDLIDAAFEMVVWLKENKYI